MNSGDSRTFRWINGFVAAMFLVSAAIQFNDPDPWRWAMVYAAAAVACLTTGRLSWSWAVAALVALVSLVWAGTMISVLRDLAFADLFKSMQAQTPIIEEGREFLGLILVGAWTVFLTVSPLRPGSE